VRPTGFPLSEQRSPFGQLGFPCSHHNSRFLTCFASRARGGCAVVSSKGRWFSAYNDTTSLMCSMIKTLPADWEVLSSRRRALDGCHPRFTLLCRDLAQRSLDRNVFNVVVRPHIPRISSTMRPYFRSANGHHPAIRNRFGFFATPLQRSRGKISCTIISVEMVAFTSGALPKWVIMPWHVTPLTTAMATAVPH
jgi:hypothetical protein